MKAIALVSVLTASALLLASSITGYAAQPGKSTALEKLLSELFKFKGVKNDPPELKLVYPIPDSKVFSNVTLIWYAFDKDKDELIYYVYIGESPDDMQLLKKTHRTFVNLQLEKGKEYFWMIEAFDGKSYTFSETWRFFTETSEEEAAKNEPSHKTLYNWTFMLYLNGDNDLYTYAQKELDEIMRFNYSNIAVVVLFDGEKNNDTFLYVFTNNSIKIPENESNMGDKDTLAEFILYAKKNYPAKHYILEIWGHGNGWLGVSFDRNDADMLTVNEIKEAIEKADLKLDILLFSACYMGNVEVAYGLKDVTKYLVASENVMLATSISHEKVLSELSNLSAEGASIKLVEGYEYTRYLSSSFAAWNMSKLDYLVEKIDDFARALAEENYSFVLNLRNDTAFSLQYIDLYNFAAKVYNITGIEEAKEVMNAINETIFAKYGSNSGVGIYFPLPIYQSKYYQDTDFALATYWDEIITNS
jgi:hypothetical protein